MSDEDDFSTRQPPAEIQDWRNNLVDSAPDTTLNLFNPLHIEREISALSFRTADGGLGTILTEELLPSEDKLRLATLRRFLGHPLGAERSQLFGNASMEKRVRAIQTIAPHFAEFIDLIGYSATLSYRTVTSLRLNPILLLGPPGIGKTFVSKRLARALGTGFHEIAMNMIDAFRIRGMNPSWKGARMGAVASMLLESETGSPVILIDEFDKPTKIHAYESPYDVFHSLLEEENAASFTDDYLQFPLRADKIIWIGSANDISNIPASIIDRLIILTIPEPSPDQLESVINNIYATANARFWCGFDPHLSQNVLNHLTTHNPRAITRLFDLAFARAASEGRRILKLEDILKSEHLVTGSTRRNQVGFWPRR